MTHGHGPTILWEKIDMTLGAVGGSTVVHLTGGLVLNESWKPIKMEIIGSLTGWALELSDGPLLFGISEIHISETEIKTVLEQDGPQSRTDNVDQEASTRMVKLIGAFFPPDVAGRPAPVVGFKGQVGAIEFLPKWTFRIPPDESGGHTFFIYNINGSAMNAETKTISLIVKHFGVWVN